MWLFLTYDWHQTICLIVWNCFNLDNSFKTNHPILNHYTNKNGVLHREWKLIPSMPFCLSLGEREVESAMVFGLLEVFKDKCLKIGSHVNTVVSSHTPQVNKMRVYLNLDTQTLM